MAEYCSHRPFSFASPLFSGFTFSASQVFYIFLLFSVNNYKLITTANDMVTLYYVRDFSSRLTTKTAIGKSIDGGVISGTNRHVEYL
jgi:hypothetical protein